MTSTPSGAMRAGLELLDGVDVAEDDGLVVVEESCSMESSDGFDCVLCTRMCEYRDLTLRNICVQTYKRAIHQMIAQTIASMFMCDVCATHTWLHI